MTDADAKAAITKLLGGFTEDALSAAFDKVSNKDHWKGPIDCVVSLTAEELVTTAHAIPFYTATGANFTALGDGKYHVTAPGYWAGPAN